MKRITILLVVTALLAVPAGALSVKKKSIKRIANPTTTNVAAPTVYQQAVKAYENDDFSTAARLINQHLEKNPNHADGWAYKAAIYSENDNPHEALKAIDMARQCRIDQNRTDFMNWLYFTRSTINLQLSDTVSAIEDLNMALRYDPTDVDSYFRRANLFKRLRRFDEALVDYGMMVQYDPKEIPYRVRSRTAKFQSKPIARPSNLTPPMPNPMPSGLWNITTTTTSRMPPRTSSTLLS